MILINDTVISEDIADEFFVCDLAKCKGACCVEGDMGAPLEEEELAILDRIQEDIKPFLSADGLAEIANKAIISKRKMEIFPLPLLQVGNVCMRFMMKRVI